MFFEPKTLIVIYKDEMIANQIKKLIETKDDTKESVTGTKDSSINVVTWTEKVWLANKKAGNISSKLLFIGNVKGVDSLIPVIDIKFEKHGVRYGWAGNQAVIYASPSEIKSIESYTAFHDDLDLLPIPQAVKDAIKPKSTLTSEKVTETNAETFEDNEVIEEKAKNAFFKKAGTVIGNFVSDISTKASNFSETNFKNKKNVERQMLFLGVVEMYKSGLEIFMNA